MIKKRDILNKKFLIYALLSLALFIIAFLLLNIIRPIDNAINILMSDIQTPLFSKIFILIGAIFNVYSVSALAVIISILLLIKHKRKEELAFGMSAIFNAISFFILKEIFARPRPLNALIQETDFAFPSGHTTTAVFFFGFLIYLCIKTKFRYRNIAIPLLILSIIIIAFSRIYINVHWLSDTIGGSFLGIFWLFLSLAFIKIEERLKTHF